MKVKKETITLPRARKGEPETMFVGINGVNYLVPKGKSADVPEAVAAEIHRAQAAEDRAFAEAEALMAKAQPQTY